ncbi:unnamed protein product [Tilletia laevis]|uniref:Uncharacterized protein n=2 Tax=Tilletia TaxID=13289 RepID=A0A8T8TMS5_9BASI|nr:hypothetical protein CF336_g3177 [Tilletia laevis]KAE8262259.1 hypothetical protein A4X03_0g2601 [Tilletia caries]CAD6904416.1 unnamed protein product [Tilletia controversa]CAD6885000.1 unnamed protein product [Tilletia caries]CAD6920852.1 unnamed protein product [Tilletia caries]
MVVFFPGLSADVLPSDRINTAATILAAVGIGAILDQVLSSILCTSEGNRRPSTRSRFAVASIALSRVLALIVFTLYLVLFQGSWSIQRQCQSYVRGIVALSAVVSSLSFHALTLTLWQANVTSDVAADGTSAHSEGITEKSKPSKSRTTKTMPVLLYTLVFGHLAAGLGSTIAWRSTIQDSTSTCALSKSSALSAYSITALIFLLAFSIYFHIVRPFGNAQSQLLFRTSLPVQVKDFSQPDHEQSVSAQTYTKPVTKFRVLSRHRSASLPRARNYPSTSLSTNERTPYRQHKIIQVDQLKLLFKAWTSLIVVATAFIALLVLSAADGAGALAVVILPVVITICVSVNQQQLKDGGPLTQEGIIGPAGWRPHFPSTPTTVVGRPEQSTLKVSSIPFPGRFHESDESNPMSSTASNLQEAVEAPKSSSSAAHQGPDRIGSESTDANSLAGGTPSPVTDDSESTRQGEASGSQAPKACRILKRLHLSKKSVAPHRAQTPSDDSGSLTIGTDDEEQAQNTQDSAMDPALRPPENTLLASPMPGESLRPYIRRNNPRLSRPSVPSSPLADQASEIMSHAESSWSAARQAGPNFETADSRPSSYHSSADNLDLIKRGRPSLSPVRQHANESELEEGHPHNLDDIASQTVAEHHAGLGTASPGFSSMSSPHLDVSPRTVEDGRHKRLSRSSSYIEDGRSGLGSIEEIDPSPLSAPSLRSTPGGRLSKLPGSSSERLAALVRSSDSVRTHISADTFGKIDGTHTASPMSHISLPEAVQAAPGPSNQPLIPDESPQFGTLGGSAPNAEESIKIRTGSRARTNIVLAAIGAAVTNSVPMDSSTAPSSGASQHPKSEALEEQAPEMTRQMFYDALRSDYVLAAIGAAVTNTNFSNDQKSPDEESPEDQDTDTRPGSLGRLRSKSTGGDGNPLKMSRPSPKLAKLTPLDLRRAVGINSVVAQTPRSEPLIGVSGSGSSLASDDSIRGSSQSEYEDAGTMSPMLDLPPARASVNHAMEKIPSISPLLGATESVDTAPRSPSGQRNQVTSTRSSERRTLHHIRRHSRSSGSLKSLDNTSEEPWTVPNGNGPGVFDRPLSSSISIPQPPPPLIPLPSTPEQGGPSPAASSKP